MMHPPHRLDSVADALVGARGAAAIGALLRAVRREVRAPLAHAALFGSCARGEARRDSDVDVLLVFAALPPDREPYATQAERIAEEVAARAGIPLSVWSMAREDLRRGRRTPMLVDALDDAIPLWSAAGPLPRVRFTTDDAFFCAGCLLARVAEGQTEVAWLRARGAERAAAARARDDVVRLCTAALLLRGVTRPRRADAVRAFVRRWPAAACSPVLHWAAVSFGRAAVPPPPSWRDAGLAVVGLRRLVREARDALAGGARLAELRSVAAPRSQGPVPRIAR